MLLVHGLECEKVFFYVYAVEVNNEREREGVVDEQLLKGEFHNIFVNQHNKFNLLRCMHNKCCSI